MNDDIRSGEYTAIPGRMFQKTVWGDNVGELEMSALDHARKFFGDGPRLRVIPDYRVFSAVTSHDRASGKAYGACVRVQVIEPDAGEATP